MQCAWEKFEPKTYKTGDWFVDSINKLWLLAQTDSGRVALIALADGNRFASEVKVKDVYHITEEEFKETWGVTGSFMEAKVSITRR